MGFRRKMHRQDVNINNAAFPLKSWARIVFNKEIKTKSAWQM